ncbi:TrkH family potassium uptake protein [Alicyclobacillus shizuokensis]|uniref:TrkH family potassium uptake protein n=1 Tax=Alicyclobacillus shizuokensis TaxID=392014 RepID=UPI00082BED19|nr:potassium transporter TrkG [Alicyclobacillus shizuokensis]MCL6626786.1 Trk family potassium uptake protein [Alicyclobacillus shizuokensis]
MTWRRMTPPQRIAVSYAVFALLGGLALLLPIAHRIPVSFTDAVFTAASAGYVTGLSSVNTESTWTPFGDALIAFLIQIGGAGITLVTTSIYLLMGRRIPLGTRILMAQDRNFGLVGVVRLFRNIVFYSFIIEGAASLLLTLYLHFVYAYAWLRAVGYSVFHCISAFNNAGFDIWSNNLEGFHDDPFVVLLTSALIILGGLGFVVLAELYSYPVHRKLSLHTKIVLLMTAVLLVVGTILIFAFEAQASMRGLGWPSKLLNAWFMSVSTRTAGFDTVPVGSMREVTWFIMCILMFIGASPGSTGGGIKTTTFYTLIKTAIATVRGNPEIVVGERSIPFDIAHRALVIFLLSMGVVTGGTLIDAALEPDLPLMKVLFEEVSAFGTVGLTTGITGVIGTPMKWVIIFTMYIGRIGIFTFLLSITQQSQSKARHVPEKIFIG